MKDFKLRAWHKKQKRMFPVYGIGKDFITEDTLDGIDPGNNCFSGEQLEDIELMLSTPLFDLNKKQVFKDDILRVKVYKNESIDMAMEERALFKLDDLKGSLKEEYVSAVKFNGCTFLLDSSDTCEVCLDALDDDQRNSFPIHEFEVIGNIYENPELLNK